MRRYSCAALYSPQGDKNSGTANRGRCSRQCQSSRARDAYDQADPPRSLFLQSIQGPRGGYRRGPHVQPARARVGARHSSGARAERFGRLSHLFPARAHGRHAQPDAASACGSMLASSSTSRRSAIAMFSIRHPVQQSRAAAAGQHRRRRDAAAAAPGSFWFAALATIARLRAVLCGQASSTMSTREILEAGIVRPGLFLGHLAVHLPRQAHPRERRARDTARQRSGSISRRSTN